MSDIILFNVLSITVLIILLASIVSRKDKTYLSLKRYKTLLYTIIMYIVVNFLSNYLDGRKDLIAILYVLDCLTFIGIDIIFIAFTSYFLTLIKKDKEKINRLVNIQITICLSRIILILILLFTGNLFYFDESGKYLEKDTVFIPYIVIGIETLFMIIITIVAKDNFSFKQFLTILIYLLLPTIPIFIERYVQNYYLTVMIIVIETLLIYCFIQAETIEEASIKEKVLEDLSRTDLLTGLNNRRSYYIKTSSIKQDDKIGVLFIDINCLKYTNDHYGHEKGDELINKFSKIVQDFYKKENIFRISGDEFVVIEDGLDENTFTLNAKKFINKLNENNYIASAGYAYGVGKCLDHLISDSETIMYQNKKIAHDILNKYHKRTR